MNIENLQQTIISNITSRLASGLPSPMRLRDLIRQIRAARTAADERAVVQKECAYIRSTFREEDNVWRCRNVAKLLYIHMLGYPAHFGQLECLKLIASPRFTDKRIGYLGAMLLLDERQDVHLLITNSLKTDLNSQVQFVVGLALCALGAICSPEMCRDLAGEIERLMKSSNTYIKKKATLCAARIVRRVPELMEMFLPVSRTLLNEKNHAVLITGITLITEMCDQSPDTLTYFKKKSNENMTGSLVRILKNLIMAGYSPEHDVCGVSDPFLQVKILRLLRLLGHGDGEASEAMTDILAQVATNTESSKNVGNAILYETVLTIMAIKSETGLRVLGVNILGRFLLNTDKNIRYVALQTLQKTVQADYNAVQRHRSTIVECLKDADPSIRKKAMELCFTLMNANNIKTMTKELLMFLEKADPEFKSVCSSNLCIACEQFSPGQKWQIDCMIHILKTAGNYVRDDVVGSLIQLISDTGSLHCYSVHALWNQLTGDLQSKQPLVQVSCWVLGEYADQLLIPNPEITDAVRVTEDEVVSTLEKIVSSNLLNLVTKEYGIQSLMKVSVRFPSQTARIKSITDVFSSHLNTELQQRATEFSCLFRKYDNLRPSVLEKMPPMKPLERKSSLLNGSVDSAAVNGGSGTARVPPHASQNHTAVNADDDLVGLDTSPIHVASHEGQNSKYDALVDIMGLDLSSTSPTLMNEDSAGKRNAVQDVLSLFDTVPPATVTTTTRPATDNSVVMTGNDSLPNLGNNSFNLDSFLTTSSSSPAHPAASESKNQEMIALNKSGLKIVFTFDQSSGSSDSLVTISMKATNTSPFTMSDFLFQAAVPKSFTLQLMPPDNTAIPSNGSLHQSLKVANPQKNQLRMRIKISYNINGKEVLEQAEINNFPQEIWSPAGTAF